MASASCQLPVVGDTGKPVGLVTADSILHALAQLKITVEHLQVSHAVVKPKKYRPEDDIFDLLDDLQDDRAILIVDVDDNLLGIVTAYDTGQYFRRRAEDLMLAEDIELGIRELLRNALGNEQGDIDPEVIGKMLNTKQDLLKQFQAALHYYFNQLDGERQKLNQGVAMEAYNKCLAPAPIKKRFTDLTFYEYQELLLHPDKWPHFHPIFKLDRQPLRQLLDSVRDTRNDLAHYKGQLSTQQRNALQFCARLLNLHKPASSLALEAMAAAPVADTVQAEPPTQPPGDETKQQTSTTTTAPARKETASRYEGLAGYLRKQSRDRQVLKLTFEEIERLTGRPLPDSARQHRAW